MYVYVRNQDSTPLMPCTPAKARKLLQAGKAKVVEHRPFTIQLTWPCEGHVQPVTLGIDKGSTTTGMACVGNGKALLAAEVHHRRDIKAKMDARRAHRKSRRARQWYRPARFANRAASSRRGRIPPCIKTNIEEVIRVIKRLPLAISQIIIDALCVATYHTGEMVPVPENNLYRIGFRARQTRKQYYSLPQKGKGRVRYQVNEEREGFHKGDIVRVKGCYVKQINSIYSDRRLAFKRVKGEPPSALPKDCQVLERERTIMWENVL